ncbi:hypothetical protein PFICI_02260 [Pestalotiopsis fici W106-1]|uniref:Putative gamma-glutamylcyclotransferase n=1 Tax=Pestalotiopsis fici (strain W106-1 / CGMCC3.15140) TaxID=1229662 RepID=W3XDX5_PESFW|nr:uncharacterized protein PFICI_02260 [Pestalotiopsis fici W106-1]ETS84235.1 hypothetical protein PFICI_02260 [Pestalotiopsis fici W106-1]
MDQIQNELELMAQGAATICQYATSKSDAVERWVKLFGYARAEAESKIERRREDINSTTISMEHWDMIREEKEAEGHDKESYEHSIDLLKHRQHSSQTPKSTAAVAQKRPARFLLKLEGPLQDIKTVQEAASLSCPPKIRQGSDDSGRPVRFCQIDSVARDKIINFVAGKAWAYDLTSNLLPDRTAEKNLSPTSAYPMLGIDGMLPQFRGGDHVLPRDNQYPVWYFFYGTLAQPKVLQSVCGEEQPTWNLHISYIFGGDLKTWGRKYKALVDHEGYAESKAVYGFSYLVVSEEVELALRVYETEKYEVVRCTIHLASGRRIMKGLTFKFVGDEVLEP